MSYVYGYVPGRWELDLGRCRWRSFGRWVVLRITPGGLIATTPNQVKQFSIEGFLFRLRPIFKSQSMSQQLF